MSWSVVPRLLRVATFRFAALYVAVFAASALALGLTVFFATRSALQEQLSARVRAETAFLQGEFRTGGKDHLLAVIGARGRGASALDYLVEDGAGVRLAGEMPAQAGLRPGWVTIDVPQGSDDDDGPERVRALVSELNGGLLLAVGDDLGYLTEVEEAIGSAFVWTVGLAALLGIGGGLLLSRAFLNRVDGIARTAEAIIGGDLARRVPVRGTGDDLDRLAGTLNRMLDRIGTLMDSHRQVSSDVAHDLRTPLTRLYQRLEDAQAHARSVPDYKFAIDAALAEADGLLETFSALLRIAHVEGASPRAGFRSVDLSAVADAIADAYRPDAEDAGHRVRTDIAPAVTVRGDKELLTQALANLVENALRHTPPGTCITISLTGPTRTGATGTGTRLVVQDDGPGVSASDLPRLVDRFYRGERSRTTPGNGLGLSLVNAVADLHGASLSLASAKPGLVVTLVFPPVGSRSGPLGPILATTPGETGCDTVGEYLDKPVDGGFPPGRIEAFMGAGGSDHRRYPSHPSSCETVPWSGTDLALRSSAMSGLPPIVPKLAALAALCGVLAGCTIGRPPPLAPVARLAPNVASLDRSQPDGSLIPADRPLTPAELGLLAVQNSPDLRAARARRGVAQAQVIEAGLIPDPVLSGSYAVLLAGPDFANAFGASLSQDITALITLSARRRAAGQAALQVDADLVWQEWQAISRAQTLAIDLVEQGRLLASLEQTRDAFEQRESITAAGVRQGNATLQDLAPDVAALTSVQTQFDAAMLAQYQRWQSLDALLGLLPCVRPMLGTALDIPPITATQADRLLGTLPERRPDLIALQLGYSAQQATLRAAVLGRFPALTLGPAYGSDTARVQTLGPSVSLSLPLFNRNRGQIAIQRATREQLRAEYLARLDTAVGGTQALVADLALLERQLVQARAGVAQARALATDASKGLQSGFLDELAYVELLSARLEKERQVIDLDQQVLDDRTALATLLGAGLPPVELVPPKEPSLF